MNLKEFRSAIARDGGVAPGSTVVRFTSAEVPAVTADTRVATFVFSDNSVDRYGDTIDARGWMLDKFMANPVALFGHDSNSVENVIGKARNVRIEGQRLIGEIEFMEASVNPNAEAVFQMVKGGYLNAVSVGFAPVEWALAKDKNRPQGVDFKKQELLEISVVPIPANPSALVQARAAGIDVDRLELQAAAAPPVKVKSLWHIAWLADILMDLDILEDCVEWETAMEEDGSVIADRLKSELQSLGQILIDMTIEEVTELLSDPDAASESVDGVVEMSARGVRMGILKSLVKADPKLAGAVLEALAAPKEKAGLVDFLAIKTGIAVAKAGKVISSDNEKKLTEALDMHQKGCDMIKAVIGSATPATEEKSQTLCVDEARARRQREADLLALAV